jgi:NADPH-dependent curcumin reductase CurA
VTREVALAARPEGEPRLSDFKVRDAPDVSPADGEVLVRNVFVSVDPYMRGRMTGVHTYVPPYEVGDTIDGGAVGRVVESGDRGFAEGDWVVSQLGWRERGVAAGGRLRKLDASVAPPSTALGVLGMPCFTAWIGLVDIGQAREGETIYVSGAAGAVGSAAAQIARLKGLRVIGSAGTAEKVEWLESLGVEAFNYRETRPKDALADGIDLYFDNVGGSILNDCLANIAMRGRVVLCGAISTYNSDGPPPGPSNYLNLLVRRGRMEGFIILDYLDRFPAAQLEMAGWIAEGKIKSSEHIVEGLEKAPDALNLLFSGGNTGKVIVAL